MHGFGTPVKRPPDSITPRFRRPMRTTSTLQKTFLPSQKRRPARQWFPTTAYRPSMRFSPYCEPFLLTVSQQRIDVYFLKFKKIMNKHHLNRGTLQRENEKKTLYFPGILMDMKQLQPMTAPSPSLPFFGKQGKPLNRDSIRSKILGGEGGGLEGEGTLL